jgi:hypothetical protein
MGERAAAIHFGVLRARSRRSRSFPYQPTEQALNKVSSDAAGVVQFS